MPTYSADAAGIIAAGVTGEFHAAYNRRFADDYEQTLRSIATVIRGTTPTLPLGWLGTIPTMRRWVSERQIKSLSASSHSVTDATWEATIGLERRLVEDEQFEAFMPRVRDLANEAAIAGLRAVVVDVYAKSPTGPDGRPLIDTAHPESGTNQSNRTTSALSESALADAIAAMMQFTDDRGEVMGIRPTHLLVGPKLMFTARRLLESTTVVVTQQLAAGGPSLTGSTNTLQGMLQLVVSPFLTGAYDDYWFVIDSSREMTAAIYYERSDVPVEVSIRNNPDSDNVFYRDLIEVGARKRFGVAAGLWQCVYGGIL